MYVLDWENILQNTQDHVHRIMIFSISVHEKQEKSFYPDIILI